MMLKQQLLKQAFRRSRVKSSGYVPDERAADAIADIKQINIPLVADIHFDYRLALKALKVALIKYVSIQVILVVAIVEAVVNAAKERGIPIRIGKRRFIRASHFRKVRVPNCRWYG